MIYLVPVIFYMDYLILVMIYLVTVGVGMT
jgi:hypothetical protein